jgi:hypothetical protein
MADYSNKMAIIGAGPVGLCIAKALLQHGISYDQLEADDELGGNWYHGVYTTAHIISSKRTTEYSDFPMPEDYPDFPSREQMANYLRAYAEHFKLRSQIQFKTKVVLARPTADQHWEVELANGERRVYKGLLVCNGHHWDRRWPNYPGEFTGEYFHSKDYKTPEQLTGKRVLVIGGGNSACDIASEAARVGRSCHLSLRRGYWFLPKTIFGVPLVELFFPWLPVALQRPMLRVLLRVTFGKYEQYGLPKPDHRIFEHHPTVNSEMLHYVKHGRIQPKPDVALFDGQRVYFVDGSVEEFDTIVCATGFHVSFPFLPPGLVPIRGGSALLYGGVCLPEYKNLYVVGTGQPRYGFGPLITRGADLIARLVKLQEQMELPLGLVMKESGMKLPHTHLVNPHALMRQMWWARKTLPLLMRKERKLRSKPRRSAALVSSQPATLQAKPDLQVY